MEKRMDLMRIVAALMCGGRCAPYGHVTLGEAHAYHARQRPGRSSRPCRCRVRDVNMC